MLTFYKYRAAFSSVSNSCVYDLKTICTTNSLFLGKKKKKTPGPITRFVLHKELIAQQKLEQERSVEQSVEVKIKQDGLSDPETRARLQAYADENDLPVPGMKNPYEKPSRKCILCEHNIELDYKNTRLLSQFVSPHTGRVYERAKTGLCPYMEARVKTLIQRARVFGLMPYTMKTPRYLRDPRLFDPFRGPFKEKQFSS